MLKAGASLIARHWAFHLPAILIAASYAHLRLTLNTQYVYATFEQLYALTAPLPFGHRILVPLLSRPLYSIGITIDDCFLVFEFLSTWLLLAVMRSVLATQMPQRWAATLAFAFPLVLPCAFLLHIDWPTLFYPYDTPAMLFIALGVLLALQDRRIALCLCAAVAALNRETAFLIPVTALLLGLDRQPLRTLLAWALLQVAIVAAIRWGIAAVLTDNPRPYGGSLAWNRGEELRIDGNLAWLSEFAHWLTLLATLTFLPLAYLGVRRFLAAPMRRLAWVAGADFVALLFVGNPYEPRIFGEMLVLLYVCVACGVQAFVGPANAVPAVRSTTSFPAAMFDRFAWPALAAGFVTALLVVRNR